MIDAATIVLAGLTCFWAPPEHASLMPQGGPQFQPVAGGGLRSAPPSGGTPEPATLLLIAGSALAYGGLRLRNRARAGAAAPERETVGD